MLSICTTVKNRSMVAADQRILRLFPNCVESIAATSVAGIAIELVVADWQSDDWPLAQWLEKVADPVPVSVLTLTGKFSRGRGLNAAAATASGDTLFFVDADALIGEPVLRRGIEVVEQGKAYFPILYSYTDPEHRTGYWRDAGFGHCMIGMNTLSKSVSGRNTYHGVEKTSNSSPASQSAVGHGAGARGGILPSVAPRQYRFQESLWRRE